VHRRGLRGSRLVAVSFRLDAQEGVVLRDEPLASHTTWRIGGPARWFCRVRTEAALARILANAAGIEPAIPVALLGMGSNILVSDAGFPGAVVRLEGEFLRVDVEEESLTCGGGAALGAVCAAAARAGLSGIEPISGIPSSVGAAVRINAGAYGGEIFDVLDSARLLSRGGQVREARAAEIPHAYRWTGLIETRQIVTRARLKLRRASAGEIEDRMRTVAEKRRGALPSEPNAGSVFKNPPGDHAGRLIEACGLKGARRGGAAISPRHANVIVNEGGAAAGDVFALMRLARDAVRDRFGITLAPEVELLGLEWE
jgi:UDP-N-acetylmuramate dehydrogenase